jgi:integrating conjugative element protein (TIGR03757 family)
MLSLSHALVGLSLFVPLTFGGSVWAGNTVDLDVFTKTERSTTGEEDERLRTAAVKTYAVDGLNRFESALSGGLPADRESAKVEALHRIHQLDAARIEPAKNAVIGLAKAMQYGVDRYPAIVFDERAVVYGVTNLIKALDRYEAWQREQVR